MDRSDLMNAGDARLRTLFLGCLAVVALAFALKQGQAILAPTALGLTLATVLGPAVRKLEHAGCPRVLGALAGLLLGVVLIAGLLFWAGPIVMDLVNALPRVSERLRDWMSEITLALRGLEALEGQLAESGEAAVEEAMPSVMDALWLAPNLMGQALVTLGTVFFYLLTRDDIHTWIGSTWRPRLVAADRAVSHYFVTITVVNLGLGCAVAAGLTIIGMPDPMLWGAAAFLLNFVLYLGPAIMVVSLTIAGLTHFAGGLVLLPPAMFLAFNMIEAQFVTPALVGRRLTLNMLAVFLAIVAGLWLWGPVGAIVALPLVVWVYVFLSAPEEWLTEAAPGSEVAE
ncbi:MAG: AI-2E family transporter [Pseudomonadota bacterium]